MGEVRGFVDEVKSGEAPDVPEWTETARTPRSPRPTSPIVASDAPSPVPTVLLAGGSTVTFGDFYADHYRELVRLATLLSGSVDNAPDLVQDCFVRLHGRWASVREPLPYIRRSVVHACASHHRHMAVTRRHPQPTLHSFELGADELGVVVGVEVAEGSRGPTGQDDGRGGWRNGWRGVGGFG